MRSVQFDGLKLFLCAEKFLINIYKSAMIIIQYFTSVQFTLSFKHDWNRKIYLRRIQKIQVIANTFVHNICFYSLQYILTVQMLIFKEISHKYWYCKCQLMITWTFSTFFDILCQRDCPKQSNQKACKTRNVHHAIAILKTFKVFNNFQSKLQEFQTSYQSNLNKFYSN